jgi:hypothetical protein
MMCKGYLACCYFNPLLGRSFKNWIGFRRKEPESPPMQVLTAIIIEEAFSLQKQYKTLLEQHVNGFTLVCHEV